MGFDIWGLHVWDLRAPFGYFEAFSGILAVLLVSMAGFLLLRYFAPRSDKKND